jgi:hypothetical protein
MGEEVIDRIIERLEELDVYYDNDYFCSNKEPMLLQKEVLEVLKQEKEHLHEDPVREKSVGQKDNGYDR